MIGQIPKICQMSRGQRQCPICEYHGFESYVVIEFVKFTSCSKMNHKLRIKSSGKLVALCESDCIRFVTCFHNGKWKTLDKYDKTIFDIGYFMELEKEQMALLNKQIYTSQITWLLCSTRLDIQKDVARLIAQMIDSIPYAPVYTEERINLFRLLTNWCNRKKVKNE